MPYVLCSFNNVALPAWEWQVAIGTGEAVDGAVELTGGRALDRFGGTRAPLRYPIDEEYEATIFPAASTGLATRGRADLLQLLNALKGQIGRYGRLVRSPDVMGRAQWANARLIELRGTRTFVNEVQQPVTLRFERFGPWRDVLTAGGNGASPGGRADLAGTGAEQTDTIVSGTIIRPHNGGNLDVCDGVLTITPEANISNLTITNNATGAVVRFMATIVAGAVWRLDCGAASVTNGGSDAFADLVVPEVDEEWLRLVPGENPLLISWSGGGHAEVGITFYDAHV